MRQPASPLRNDALGCGVMVRIKDRALHEQVDEQVEDGKDVSSALYQPSHGAYLAVTQLTGHSFARFLMLQSLQLNIRHI